MLARGSLRLLKRGLDAFMVGCGGRQSDIQCTTRTDVWHEAFAVLLSLLVAYPAPLFAQTTVHSLSWRA